MGFVHAHPMANGENCTMHTYNNTYILHKLLANLQDMHTLLCDDGVCWFPIYMKNGDVKWCRQNPVRSRLVTFLHNGQEPC